MGHELVGMNFMVKFITIGSKNEKGRALERIFGDALSSLGYTNLRYNTYSTGEEIDIQGERRVTSQPIKCQCKAHKEQIGTPDLGLFWGVILTLLGNQDARTTSIFISSSGFNGTALQWYQEKINDEEKSRELIEEYVGKEKDNQKNCEN